MTSPSLCANDLRLLLPYNAETGSFTWKESRLPAETKMGPGYLGVRVKGRVHYAHRLAWFYVYGEWPLVVDHINGNPVDNSLSNLRSGTQSQNLQNQTQLRKDNSTGHIGIDKRRNKYRAVIGLSGEKIYLGDFLSLEEAKAAYLEAKRELHPFSTL